MKYLQMLYFGSMVCLMSACGGGGGSESTAAVQVVTSPQTESEPVVVVPTEPQVMVAATQEIQVPKGFTLAANFTVSLDVKLDETHSQRVSLSVCTDFTRDGDEVEINYDSCLLKASTQDGRFVSELQVGTALDALILAVGYFDEAGGIDYRFWEKDGAEPYRFVVR